MIMYAISKAHNRSLNCSSLEMLYGCAPIPLVPELTLTDMDNLIEDFVLLKNLTYVQEGAKDHEGAYIEKENIRNAKNKNDERYELGDLVLKLPFKLGYTPQQKHTALFVGPWKVIGRDKGGIKYDLEREEDGHVIKDTHRHFLKNI